MPNHLETREAAYGEAIRSGRIKMLLVLLVCAAPVIASYVSFYFLKPEGRTNYGTLVEVKPLPAAALTLLDGKAFKLGEFKGKWVLVTQDSGECNEACTKKLYAMRQARTIIGREQDRVMRVVLLTDDGQPSAELQAAYKGTVWVKAKDHPWLAALAKLNADNPQKSSDEIYGVDTLGNLFIRYQYDADIKLIVRDFNRVMKASQIG